MHGSTLKHDPTWPAREMDGRLVDNFWRQTRMDGCVKIWVPGLRKYLDLQKWTTSKYLDPAEFLNFPSVFLSLMAGHPEKFHVLKEKKNVSKTKTHLEIGEGCGSSTDFRNKTQTWKVTCWSLMSSHLPPQNVYLKKTSWRRSDGWWIFGQLLRIHWRPKRGRKINLPRLRS